VHEKYLQANQKQLEQLKNKPCSQSLMIGLTSSFHQSLNCEYLGLRHA
jgi:hypothetical protein